MTADHLATLGELALEVRSKNAGPFWITLDLSFADQAAFDRHAFAPQLQPAAMAAFVWTGRRFAPFLAWRCLQVASPPLVIGQSGSRLLGALGGGGCRRF